MNAIERMIERLTSEIWLLGEPHFMAILQRCMVAMEASRQPHSAGEGTADRMKLREMYKAAAGENLLPWERDDWYQKPQVINGVAVIPIDGTLAKGMDSFTRWWFGIPGTETVQSWIEAATVDPKIKAIVLNVNSPGGTVVGTPELGAAVAAARQEKPVIAYTGVLMASAAYWAAAGASAIYASPSAVVGSIGVYMVVYDWSQFFERVGLKADLFKAGVFKAAGVPGTRLNDAQRVNFQDGVNDLMKDFRAHVTAFRSVADSSMEGQTFYAEKAVALGLVDSLSTLEIAIRDAGNLADLQRGKR